MEFQDRRQVCKVCLRQFARYTCPRCNLAYCSVACYKPHGERCTEAFYREQASSELQRTHVGAEDKRRMLDILQRVKDEQEEGSSGAESGDGWTHLQRGCSAGGNSSDEDEGSDDKDSQGDLLSEATLQKLVLKAQEQGTDFSFDEGDLTSAEQRAFHRAVAAGRLSHLVEPWQPWWEGGEAAELRLNPSGQPFVVEVDQNVAQLGVSPSNGDERAGHPGQLPAPPSAPLPSLQALTRTSPSPLLRWQLLQLLNSYCHVLRIHNGDYTSDLQGAADLALALAPSLAPLAAAHSSPSGAANGSDKVASSGNVHAPSAQLPPAESAAEAVLRCIESTCRPPVGDASSRSLAIATLGDACQLLRLGRACVVLALTDLQRLLNLAMEEVGPDGKLLPPLAGPLAATPNGPLTCRRKKFLQAASRKVLFYSVWANEQNEEDCFASLRAATERELAKQAALLGLDRGRHGPGRDGSSGAARSSFIGGWQQQQQARQHGGSVRPAVFIEELPAGRIVP